MSHDNTERISVEETKLSHYIQTQDKFGNPINIPVIDVRDGLAERYLAEGIEKATRRSKYITFTDYHVSRKQAKSL